MQSTKNDSTQKTVINEIQLRKAQQELTEKFKVILQGKVDYKEIVEEERKYQATKFFISNIVVW
jgi:hypothetical protein